jgi:hypothetical protein
MCLRNRAGGCSVDDAGQARWLSPNICENDPQRTNAVFDDDNVWWKDRNRQRDTLQSIELHTPRDSQKSFASQLR